MDLQTLIVALIVAVAALSVGARVVRSVNVARERKKQGGCGGSCCG